MAQIIEAGYYQASSQALITYQQKPLFEEAEKFLSKYYF